VSLDYLDTSATGKPVTASGTVKDFGAEVDFFISIASNLIAGQSTGPTTQFTIYSKKNGVSTVNVDYGTVNANWAEKYSGYRVEAAVGAGAGAVSCRVVIKSSPFPLEVVTVATAASSTGSSPAQPSGGTQLGTAVSSTGIYKGPAGYKAILLRAIFTKGAATTLYSQVHVQNGIALYPDWITPVGGSTAWDVNGEIQVGFGPGNVIQLLGPIVLLPGDVFDAWVDSGTSSYCIYEFLLIPL